MFFTDLHSFSPWLSHLPHPPRPHRDGRRQVDEGQDGAFPGEALGDVEQVENMAWSNLPVS